MASALLRHPTRSRLLRRGARGGRGGRRAAATEVHGRRPRDLGLVLHREVRLHRILEDHRGEIGRERAQRHVVLLHGLDIAIARHRDAILGALELRLQIAKILIRFQLRVVFADCDQALQRLRQLSLRGFKFLKRLRVVDQLRSRLDGADLGARLGDADQHFLLLGRKPLDGVDQVRHQIGPALVLVDHFRPGRLDGLILLLNLVVATAARQQCTDRYQTNLERTHSNRSSASDSADYNGGPFWGFQPLARNLYTKTGAGFGAGKKTPRLSQGASEAGTPIIPCGPLRGLTYSVCRSRAAGCELLLNSRLKAGSRSAGRRRRAKVSGISRNCSMGRYRTPQQPGSKYIPAAGAARLRAELDELWRRERPQVTAAVAAAAAQGDRSENAEYTYGKRRLREIDRRVRFLRARLIGMVIVDKPPSDRQRVFFGARVTLDTEDGQRLHYRIVGPDEFDAASDYISMDAPLGKALLGKRLDDEFELTLECGTERFTIVRVDYT